MLQYLFSSTWECGSSYCSNHFRHISTRCCLFLFLLLYTQQMGKWLSIVPMYIKWKTTLSNVTCSATYYQMFSKMSPMLSVWDILTAPQSKCLSVIWSNSENAYIAMVCHNANRKTYHSRSTAISNKIDASLGILSIALPQIARFNSLS